MKNLFLYSIISLFFVGCNKQKTATVTQLNFLDEFVIKDSLLFKNDLIGGLSGVDYANGMYYFVVDDAIKPRFLKANISVEQQKIKSINFENSILLNDSLTSFYKENSLDLESIFVDETTQEINFISEGSIKNHKKPLVFKTNLQGQFLRNFELPLSFQKLENIQHNAVFEGSAKSFDANGFWVAMEGVLKKDGVEATFKKTVSPVRITYFDNNSGLATKQFAYQLENITKPAKGNINLNGVTAILEYTKNKFFVVERTYQSGYGPHGNIVRIFDAHVDDQVTDVLKLETLNGHGFTPLKKRLLLDFDTLRNNLTDSIVDNIEGITFGPNLKNGSKTLLLVSDDNFQKYGKQLTQFILLEVATN